MFCVGHNAGWLGGHRGSHVLQHPHSSQHPHSPQLVCLSLSIQKKHQPQGAGEGKAAGGKSLGQQCLGSPLPSEGRNKT